MSLYKIWVKPKYLEWRLITIKTTRKAAEEFVMNYWSHLGPNLIENIRIVEM